MSRDTVLIRTILILWHSPNAFVAGFICCVFWLFCQSFFKRLKLAQMWAIVFQFHCNILTLRCHDGPAFCPHIINTYIYTLPFPVGWHPMSYNNFQIISSLCLSLWRKIYLFIFSINIDVNTHATKGDIPHLRMLRKRVYFWQWVNPYGQLQLIFDNGDMSLRLSTCGYLNVGDPEKCTKVLLQFIV